MTNKRSTKSALLTSCMALLLCFTMLLGTTFAWFTDSVTSANNIIKSGNLDVTFEYWNGSDWADVSGNANILTNELWEPGVTEVAYLKVSNAGSLALKYELGVNIVTETAGVNVAGDAFKLSDYLYFGVIQDAKENAYANRADAVAAVADAKLISAGYTKASTIEAGEDDQYFALVVYMPETVDNVANHNGTGIPEIKLGLNVVATQLNAELDSFDADYDKDATLDFYPVASAEDLSAALANGEDSIVLTESIAVQEGYIITKDVKINANGNKITRTSGIALMTLDADAPTVYTGTIFTVKEGATLTLENVIVDGGADWTGEVNETLQRGTVNAGITATGALVTTETNATVVLNKGAVLKNNDGANAVNLGTRSGGKLIINGGEIINNHSASGAIWGGGKIVLNSGKVNGNHGGIGGAIRVVTNVGTVLEMNGGQMNHNLSDGTGGAIWAGTSKSNNVYVLNGGEMAYNYSPSTGGAIYAGHYETVKIGGTFKMHDNDSAASIGDGIRFHDHAVLVMTGGEVYNNGENSFYLNNNSATITGGKITDNFTYSGGLDLTWGEATIDGVLNYNLATNHNTAYLAKEFNTLNFTVNESASNFSKFNFSPASGYVYAEGDEAKLVCKNAGYETYWDEATATFRLRTK